MFETSAASAPLIVHVVRQFAPSRGGLEDVVLNLARQQVRRGLRGRVITCNKVFANPDLGTLPAHEPMQGIEIVRINWHGSTRYPVSPGVFRHLSDADLVHVHAVDFFFDWLSFGWLLHRKPMVATTHGGFFHTQKFAKIKKVWFQTLTRAASLGYRRLVCCSQSDGAVFNKIAGGRTLVIENGADTSKFAGRAAGSFRRRIITIGRFSVNKRLDRLIAAVAALATRESDWHLDIVGVPHDQTKADLDRWAQTCGIGDRVAVHVGLENAAIADLISQASVFASASDYEGFGLVAVEAMSAGLLPVLEANTAYTALKASHPDLVLTDFSQPDRAAADLAAFASLHDAERQAMRERLMRQAHVYSWDHVADLYLDAYRSVLKPGILPLAAVAAE